MNMELQSCIRTLTYEDNLEVITNEYEGLHADGLIPEGHGDIMKHVDAEGWIDEPLWLELTDGGKSDQVLWDMEATGGTAKFRPLVLRKRVLRPGQSRYVLDDRGGRQLRFVLRANKMGTPHPMYLTLDDENGFPYDIMQVSMALVFTDMIDIYEFLDQMDIATELYTPVILEYRTVDF